MLFIEIIKNIERKIIQLIVSINNYFNYEFRFWQYATIDAFIKLFEKLIDMCVNIKCENFMKKKLFDKKNIKLQKINQVKNRIYSCNCESKSH